MTMDSAIFNFKRILAIGAHPDDIEFGCLGFLLRQPKEVEKHIYVGCTGSIGDSTTGNHRIDESKTAYSFANPASTTFRAKAGITSTDFSEVMTDLDRLVTKIQPDLILCLGPHDTHQEHRAIHEITLASARRSKASFLNYGILSNTLEFRPNLFVDISKVYEFKKKALLSHVSQKNKYYMTDEYLEIFHSDKYASLHGIRYSESYEIVRLFV
jgi:LmbE family N-acetylglucosaminyl deacetylase